MILFNYSSTWTKYIPRGTWDSEKCYSEYVIMTMWWIILHHFNQRGLDNDIIPIPIRQLQNFKFPMWNRKSKMDTNRYIENVIYWRPFISTATIDHAPRPNLTTAQLQPPQTRDRKIKLLCQRKSNKYSLRDRTGTVWTKGTYETIIPKIMKESQFARHRGDAELDMIFET